MEKFGHPGRQILNCKVDKMVCFEINALFIDSVALQAVKMFRDNTVFGTSKIVK